MESKLVYKKDFEKNSFRLIELGTPELQEAFESGDSITIKGLVDDEAVLCTKSKTFIIRQVHTSNSILLLEKESPEKHLVHDDVSSTIELTPCLARLSRIDDLLRDTVYSGQKNEKKIRDEKKLYTYHDLLSVVQASEDELLEGLEKRGAFEHEGYFRLLDKSYLLRLFDSLLNNVLVHGYDITNMTLDQAKQSIQEEMTAVDDEEMIPDTILTACVNTFASSHVDDKIRFDEEKVCRFLGEWVLSNPRNKRWELDDFMDVWKRLGHEIFTPKIEHIAGLYIMHENTRIQKVEKFIQYFSVNELPTDPAQRFSALFAEKPLWKSDEITAFISDLAPTKKGLDSLLLKFARTHREKNLVLYGSRIK